MQSRTGVPVIDLDHHSAAFAAHADERWRQLRETCPVAWSTEYGGFWVVSGYEGNHEVLEHHEIFTSERWPDDDGHGTSQIPSFGKGESALPLEIDESAITPYPDRGFAQGWLNLPARFTPGSRRQ